MNSAYAVGATFTLENLVSKQLTKISEDMAKLDTKIEAKKKNLQGIVPAKSILARIEEVCGSFDLLGANADANARRIAGAMDLAVGAVTKSSASIRGELEGAFMGADAEADAAALAMTTAIGRAASSISAEAVTIKGALLDAFVDFGAGLDGSVTGVTTQLARITTSAGEAAAAIASIRREMEGLAALPAVAMPAFSGGAAAPGGAHMGQRRSGHGSGGPHFGRVGTEIPGGHASIGGGPGLAAAGVIGFGIYEAAEMRDEVNKLMITGQVSPEEWGGKRDQLSKLLMDSASLTGFSVGQVGEALSKSERAMASLDVNTKMDVTKALIPYAAAEAKLKDTSLAESLESMVGLAHMTGTYDPAAIADLARKFSFVSLSTNSSLPAFERTLSYSMPILRTGMGMDPDTIMALTAAAQNSGITSSKSGTWLRSFFEGSEPETGDGDHAKNHNAALKKFGLLNDSNMPTWKVNDANGKTDWTASVAKEAEILGAHLRNLPVDERMGVVKQIWGERGGGMASMLSMGTFVDQFTTLAAKIQAFKGGESALEEYAKDNTAQKARETWRDFENILMDIGNTALPTVNAALQNLDIALKAIPEDWEKTKKMWSDRLHWLTHPFGDGANTPPKPQIPQDAPNTGYLMGPGFQLNAYHEGSIGGVSDAEETIYRGTLRAFTDFAAGKSVSGGMGGGGFLNASWEGGSFGFGGGSGSIGGGGGHGHSAPSIRYGRPHTSAPGSLVDPEIAKFAGGATFAKKSPEVMKRLMADFNLDPVQAAKILGNLGHESIGFSTYHEIGQPLNKGGIGWAQWTGPRNHQYLDWSAQNHLDPHSDEANYGFLKHELMGPYSRGITALKNGASLEEFERIFEGAGVKAYGSRHKYEAAALRAYNEAKGAMPTATFKAAPKQPIHVHVDTALNVDGRKMASVVSYHQAKSMRYPRSIGLDPHGHFVNPTTPVMDSA